MGPCSDPPTFGGRLRGAQTWEPFLGKCAVRLNDSSADTHVLLDHRPIWVLRSGERGLVLAAVGTAVTGRAEYRRDGLLSENIATDRLWPFSAHDRTEI